MRRILSGGVVVLLIGRSFDPGAAGTPTPAPLAETIITYSWFVLLLGAALWHAWAKPGLEIGGWVAVGLVVTAALVALRALVGTANDWLATLTVWQWLALPAAFVVVRQLAANRFDSRGLLAVIVATAASAMAANSVPRIAAMLRFEWPETPALASLIPEGGDELALGLDHNTGGRHRAWSHDLFWLAIVGPIAVAFAAASRKMPMMLRWPMILPLLILIAGVGARLLNDPPPAPASWATGVSMIANSPGGVGPGLYSRYAARHTPPDADRVQLEPANSVLGLVSTAGVAVLLALGATIWVLIRRLRETAPPEPPLPINLVERTRWELYAGGLVGLAAGFVLQVLDWPGVERPPMAYLGAIAVVRGLVWFVVLACAERALSFEEFDRAAAPGLLIAIAAALLYDVLRPGLSEAFWVAAAVTINLVSPPALLEWARTGIGRLLPVLVTFTLLAGITVTVLLPAIRSGVETRSAVRQMPNYSGKVGAIERAEGVPARSAARSEAVRHIRRMVVQPLLESIAGGNAEAANAAIVEPLLSRGPSLARDVRPATVASPWCIAAWEHGASGDFDKLGIACAMLGQKADSASAAGFAAEFAARQTFASASANKRNEQFERLEALIGEVLKREPALAARLRFRIAAAQIAAQNRKQGEKEAAAALELDQNAPGPRYRLTESERRQAQEWLGKPAP